MSKAKLFDYLLCLDLEATCWDTNAGEQIPPGEQSEIIEVGIALLDLKKLEIIESEGIIVKPVKSRISNFCTQLTSITQEMVDEGITLEEAMQKLQEKYKINKRTMATYGDYDKKMLISDCADKGIVFPGERRSCINIKNVLAVEYGWNKEVGLDTTVKRFGLEFEGHHHRGYVDALMVAKIWAKHLKNLRKNVEEINTEHAW